MRTGAVEQKDGKAKHETPEGGNATHPKDVAARDGIDFARDADEDRALGGLHLVLDMFVDVQQLVGGHEHPAGRRLRHLGDPPPLSVC